MDNLSLEAVKGEVAKDTWVLPEDEKAVLAYLRLSEDELDLRAKGWISTSTWHLWWGGVQVQLSRAPFKKIWEQVRIREEAFGDAGEYKRLRGAHAEGPDFDPCPWWRRLLHGP